MLHDSSGVIDGWLVYKYVHIYIHTVSVIPHKAVAEVTKIGSLQQR